MSIEISRDELEKIYYDNTNLRAAEILEVSKVTLIEMIDRAGIKRKEKGNKSKYEIV